MLADTRCLAGSVAAEVRSVDTVSKRLKERFVNPRSGLVGYARMGRAVWETIRVPPLQTIISAAFTVALPVSRHIRKCDVLRWFPRARPPRARGTAGARAVEHWDQRLKFAGQRARVPVRRVPFIRSG